MDCRSKSSHERLDALVWGITGRKLTRSISQIGQEYFLTIQRPHQPDRVSKIYTLTNPDNGNLLYLTWETFGKGIENLANETETCPQGPHEPQLSYPRRRISTDERSMLGVTGLNANHVCDGIRTLLKSRKEMSSGVFVVRFAASTRERDYIFRFSVL